MIVLAPPQLKQAQPRTRASKADSLIKACSRGVPPRWRRSSRLAPTTFGLLRLILDALVDRLTLDNLPPCCNLIRYARTRPRPGTG
jgi:hypothetical protein